MTLNQTPPMKIFRVRHCLVLTEFDCAILRKLRCGLDKMTQNQGWLEL